MVRRSDIRPPSHRFAARSTTLFGHHPGPSFLRSGHLARRVQVRQNRCSSAFGTSVQVVSEQLFKCVRNTHPSKSRSQIIEQASWKRAKVVSRRLLEARGNGTEALEVVEAHLDAKAESISAPVEPRLLLPRRIRADNRFDAESLQLARMASES